MTELLLIVVTILVGYVIYAILREQKITTHSSISPVEEPDQSSESVKSQANPEKPAETVNSVTPRSDPKNAKVAVKKPVAAAKEKPVPELVGLTAGSVWNYLNKNGPTTVAKLVREQPEDEKTVQRSIGWLAQEGKITLDIIDRAETISLKE